MKKGLHINTLSGTKVFVTKITDTSVEYTREPVYINDNDIYRRSEGITKFVKPIHVFEQTYEPIEIIAPECS
jgi:hypothetical protein